MHYKSQNYYFNKEYATVFNQEGSAKLQLRS